MAALGQVFLMLVAIAWGTIVGGYTLSVMWGWFMVPQFGLPGLSLAGAIGVKMVFVAVRGVDLIKKESQKPFDEQMISIFIGLPFVYGVALLMGYIVKQFL